MTSPQPGPSADELLKAAEQARKDNKAEEACTGYRSFLRQQYALLWLSKLSQDPLEARAAADLALRLDPTDEVAKRAVKAAQERVDTMAPELRSRAELSVTAVLTTGMTLREARAVIWPFRKINRPIGDVFDDGTITLGDLGWALEKAWGPVLTAARTILFTHVANIEPGILPRPLTVISGSRYAEHMQQRSLVISMLAASATLAVCAVLVITGILSIWFHNGVLIWIVLIASAPFVLYLPRLMDRMGEQARNYRHGRWGEERIVENMRALLDGQWALFRNLSLPDGNRGDVDMILVGPGGIWAFEVKTFSGAIRNVEDTWQCKGKRGWYTLHKNPGKQARANAARVKTFLATQNIAIDFVQPVVLWASSPDEDFEVVGTLTVERPKTPVWKTEELPDQIESLIQEQTILSTEAVDRIVELLRATAQETRRRELHMYEQPDRTGVQAKAH
jgi:hypothetical protein